jgi:acetyltransferase-like isoleucine patch superfamily enzyme
MGLETRSGGEADRRQLIYSGRSGQGGRTPLNNRARFTAPNATLLGEMLTVGDGTWIGFNCLLDGQVAELEIGKWCDISSGTQIYTHSTHLRCTERGEKVIGPVKLEDHVFIGANSVILPATKIGHHSIVGALSVVKGEFPPNSLIVGAPAKLKRKLTSSDRQLSRQQSAAAPRSTPRIEAKSRSTHKAKAHS